MGDRVKIILSTTEQEKYLTGVLLTDEFVSEDGEESVIFKPIEDGVEIPDLQYIIPSLLLDHWD